MCYVSVVTGNCLTMPCIVRIAVSDKVQRREGKRRNEPGGHLELVTSTSYQESGQNLTRLGWGSM